MGSAKRSCLCLFGYLNVPIAVGSKGGSLGTHPAYKWMLEQLLRNGDKRELNAKDIANIIVSAGLAQNFAALRALAVEGIQKGHMRLHDKKKTMKIQNQQQQIPHNALSIVD